MAQQCLSKDLDANMLALRVLSRSCWNTNRSVVRHGVGLPLVLKAKPRYSSKLEAPGLFKAWIWTRKDHRMFFATFCTFPRWDRTGCLKEWELDKGRKRKTILWSANRKFQTPPPPPYLHRPLFRVWPLFRFWTPPPPPLLRTDPYSGLTLIPGSTLPVLALQRSLHRDMTLSSRIFRVEGQVNGERASLPGIRLLFPSASKKPAWLFPSPSWPRLRLGQYVGSDNNRRYFLGLEK